MSKKGDCFDNAAMESWNGRLKVEAIHGERFATRSQAKAQVFEYIEVYYNRLRLHSKLDFVSPKAFEARPVAQQPVRDFGVGSYIQIRHYVYLKGLEIINGNDAKTVQLKFLT